MIDPTPFIPTLRRDFAKATSGHGHPTLKLRSGATGFFESFGIQKNNRQAVIILLSHFGKPSRDIPHSPTGDVGWWTLQGYRALTGFASKNPRFLAFSSNGKLPFPDPFPVRILSPGA